MSSQGPKKTLDPRGLSSKYDMSLITMKVVMTCALYVKSSEGTQWLC